MGVASLSSFRTLSASAKVFWGFRAIFTPYPRGFSSLSACNRPAAPFYSSCPGWFGTSLWPSGCPSLRSSSYRRVSPSFYEEVAFIGRDEPQNTSNESDTHQDLSRGGISAAFSAGIPLCSNKCCSMLLWQKGNTLQTTGLFGSSILAEK